MFLGQMQHNDIDSTVSKSSAWCHLIKLMLYNWWS